ncbi:hypothetical protein HDU93_003601 [Gonapodya sp. JEL0774]|nr:hypothetical protein HDU93_003601 [Gonapodya sp. JEL0774]
MFHRAFSPAMDRTLYIRTGTAAENLEKRGGPKADGLTKGTRWCGEMDSVVRYEVVDDGSSSGEVQPDDSIEEASLPPVTASPITLRILSVRVSLSWIVSGLAIRAGSSLQDDPFPSYIPVPCIPVARHPWYRLKSMVEKIGAEMLGNMARYAMPVSEGTFLSPEAVDGVTVRSLGSELWDPTDPRVLALMDTAGNPVPPDDFSLEELARTLAREYIYGEWSPRMRLGSDSTESDTATTVSSNHTSGDQKFNADAGTSQLNQLDSALRKKGQELGLVLSPEVMWKYSFAKRLLAGDATWTPQQCAETITRAEILYRTVGSTMASASDGRTVKGQGLAGMGEWMRNEVTRALNSGRRSVTADFPSASVTFSSAESRSNVTAQSNNQSSILSMFMPVAESIGRAMSGVFGGSETTVETGTSDNNQSQ